MSNQVDYYSVDETPVECDPPDYDEAFPADPEPTSEQAQEALLVEIVQTMRDMLAHIRAAEETTKGFDIWTNVWRRLDHAYFDWRNKLENERWIEQRAKAQEADTDAEFTDPFADQ